MPHISLYLLSNISIPLLSFFFFTSAAIIILVERWEIPSSLTFLLYLLLLLGQLQNYEILDEIDFCSPRISCCVVHIRWRWKRRMMNGVFFNRCSCFSVCIGFKKLPLFILVFDKMLYRSFNLRILWKESFTLCIHTLILLLLFRFLRLYIIIS